MKSTYAYATRMAIKKASKSLCNYKVAAAGFDARGELVGIAHNRPRFDSHGGGIHAEIALLRRYGSCIRSILLFRVNKSGWLLPIVPCPVCSKVLNRRNIRVQTIYEL